MSTVAVVGLGAMGSRIARRLLDAGHGVLVWNRTPGTAEELVAAGADQATSPADAARRADAVITMVADPAALEAVTEGPDGVVAGADESTTFRSKALFELTPVGLQDPTPCRLPETFEPTPLATCPHPLGGLRGVQLVRLAEHAAILGLL